MDRVAEAIAVYREVIDRLGAERVVAVATSAMRDAENGPAFRDFLKERFGIDARTISGDEEARLTFLGATGGRNDDRETLVIDIGGGSTEYVVGLPGARAELPRLDADGLGAVHGAFLRATSERDGGGACSEIVPEVSVEQGIAVAGTATSLAAIDGAEEVHGYRLSLGRLRAPHRDARGHAARGAPQRAGAYIRTARPRSWPAR